MEILESIILGAVQGLTEFLPVSSSGHLQLAKELLGVDIEENLTFDVTLHAATVLSTIVVLWHEPLHIFGKIIMSPITGTAKALRALAELIISEDVNDVEYIDKEPEKSDDGEE